MKRARHPHLLVHVQVTLYFPSVFSISSLTLQIGLIFNLQSRHCTNDILLLLILSTKVHFLTAVYNFQRNSVHSEGISEFERHNRWNKVSSDVRFLGNFEKIGWVEMKFIFCMSLTCPFREISTTPHAQKHKQQKQENICNLYPPIFKGIINSTLYHFTLSFGKP